MTFKINPEHLKRLQAQDSTVIRGVLAELNDQLVKRLKQDKEDIRYVQGFSAAVDYLLSLTENRRA